MTAQLEQFRHKYAIVINGFDQELIESKARIAQWQDDINNLSLTSLENKITNLKAVVSRKEANISKKEALGKNGTKKDYNYIISNNTSQVTNIEKINKLLKQLQHGCEKGSTKWQEYQEQIDSNREAIIDLNISTINYMKTIASSTWDKANEKVERYSEKIDLLTAKMDNLATNNYKDKNSYLTKISKQYTKNIEIQEKAVNNTVAEKKNVKSKIKRKWLKSSNTNEDGTLKTDKVISKSQKNYIKQYNEYVKVLKSEKQELKSLKQEYKSNIKEIQIAKFNNIVAYYDQKTDINSAKQNAVQNQMDIAESKGYLLDKVYYNKLISLQETELNRKIQEREKLINRLSKVEPYTDNWYEMQKAIYDCDDAIANGEKAIVDFQKAIEKLNFSNFETLMSLMDNVITESDFLLDLLDKKTLINDKTGEFTNNGLASLGQHAYNYDVYMAQADKYAKKIKNINKKLADNPYDRDLLDKRQEYLEAQQSSITSALDEKNSIIDLVEDGLNAKLNALKELIDKEKEALDIEQDLYEFQKKLKKQTKDIASIQKQINALEGDDSEENRKRLQELRQQLADAQDELDDTMYNKSIDDQKDALDELYNTEKEKVENYLKDTDRVFKDAISQINANSNIIAQSIKNVAKEVGYSIDNNIISAWTNAGMAVSEYSNTFSKSSIGVIQCINNIKTSWDEALASYKEYAKETKVDTVDEYSNYTSKNSSGSSTSNKTDNSTKKTTNLIKDFISGLKDKSSSKYSYKELSSLNKYMWDNYGKVATQEEMLKLSKILGLSSIKTVDGSDEGKKNKKEILSKLKLAGFYNGGVIEDTTNALKEVVKNNKDDVLVTAKKGECIVSKEVTEELSKMFGDIKTILPVLDMSKTDLLQNSNANIVKQNLSPIYNIDNSIKVDGIATQELLPQFESIAKNQIENTIAKINKLSYAKGTRIR